MAANTFTNKLFIGVKHRAKSLFNNPYAAIGLNWFQVKNLKHLSVGKERELKILNGTMHFISPQELLHGLDEIFIEKIYDQAFSANAYIIDCGANIGMSVIKFKSLSPDAMIEAFEPDSSNFEILEKNVKGFHLKDVRLHKAAVWKENTKLRFASDGSMSSRINEESNDAGRVVEVAAIRLKDYLIKKVDFLKIDIEGAEYAVIEDISDSLHFVQKMFVEYHGTFIQNEKLLRMLEIIRAAGFSFYIKEATSVYEMPFIKEKRFDGDWDVQLNIFCFRN